MSPDQLEPDQYQLAGGDAQILYSTTSVDGQPLFSYTGPEGEHTFSGDEIATAETELGREVTVVLSAPRDGDEHTLTVLIPPVRLEEGSDAALDTVAIETTKRSSLAGPPPGADYSYEVTRLTGSAQFVES